MKRFLIYTAEIIICFVLQSAMFHYVQLADIMPNLLLILVVSTAYMRGRTEGLLVGFFSGLLVDLMFGSNVVGLYALLYLLIGYMVGFTNKIYSNDDYTLPIIFIAISDLVYGFFYYIFEFLLRGRLDFLYYLRRIILPEMIYTVAVSIFLYKLLHLIHNRLNRNSDEEA
ncbi:MAG: rod shape-determining protein MreD [Mobilitalea sp.]